MFQKIKPSNIIIDENNALIILKVATYGVPYKN